MNWFDTSGLTSLAKTALKEAQKTIDKALDIQESPSTSPPRSASPEDTSTRAPPADFLSSWGLTTSGESAEHSTAFEEPITESPSKANQSLWGSFAGSFFEPGKPSAEHNSLNTSTDKTLGSQDDLFSRSKLVVSDGHDPYEESSGNRRDRKNKAEEISRSEETSSASLLNRLSIVSCESGKNSSDSVEVLGSHSLKTTPDSEAPSVHSVSHSSSTGERLASDSVEILPNSLISPSSIEFLGFDSFCSERSSTECLSSNLSPLEEQGDKDTPTCISTTDHTTDSVSLVADDDDDTVSYNSVSECTAPTILDTEDKLSLSPNPRLTLRSISDAQRNRLPDIKDSPIEHIIPLAPHNINSSENYSSSNDGSWSDRTLNADNDSVTETYTEDKSKQKAPDKIELETTEEPFIDKLSDSSSFYNVNVTADTCDNVGFVNVDKTLCGSPTEGCSKDKERVSPISSESRSDLVKIGSDRTSTHTSGDELETTTSSDIEIIPSPNGDNGHVYSRASPGKYVHLKNSKFDGATSPHLVDLVLGKSFVTKIRGHNRELSEASIQSNTSDESHNSENERLMRRLCEMAEILEARESRIVELSRSNVDLVESNAELRSQMEALRVRHEAGDVITDDYAQRMSALEKKFQQAIREKDILRKQLECLKTESTSKRTSELESAMREKDSMIAQLQEEGEKLSKLQFTQSNIIKKLRVKEKENEQVIKSLRDKIAEQTSELDRQKRAISAKEELEVSQIEAVYKLTNANKKLDTELEETRSALDDTTHKLEGARRSLEAARRELVELQRSGAELQRRRDACAELEAGRLRADEEAARLRAQLDSLRAKMVQEERAWASREEALRRQLGEARATCAALEARAAEGAAGGAGGGGGALLAQLAALQRSCVERERNARATRDRLTATLAEAETRLNKALEMERVAREECAALQERAAEGGAARAAAEARRDALAAECAGLADRLRSEEQARARMEKELQQLRAERAALECELRARLDDTGRLLQAERTQLDAERRRNAILQEQLAAVGVGAAAGPGTGTGGGRLAPGDVSPPHSLASDSLSASLWGPEEGSECGAAGGGCGAAGGVFALEEVVARLQRREGEVRALSAAAAAHSRQLQALHRQLADARNSLANMQALQEQYDALLQMYGEKEEQAQELRLDLQDVTQLYKSQLDEIIALKRQIADTISH